MGQSLERLFDIVDYLVDDRVGVIQYVKEAQRQPGAPEFFHFYAQPCNVKAFNCHENSQSAGGASVDRRVAMAKAVGEAVERYCSALVDVSELPLAPFKSGLFPCVPPSEFVLYSHIQYALPDFPFVPFSDMTPVRWTPALDTVTCECVFVPAAMVFVPYFYDRDHGEVPVVQPISTGLACHCSWAEAANSAVCEVIERDAFTITWQARLGMPQIRKETLSHCNRDLIERFERNGDIVTVLNITMDHGVPTILSVLSSDAPESPARVFAASANLNPEEAVRKSLEELAHTRRLADWLTRTRSPIELDPSYANVVGQDSHVLLHCDHANKPLSGFILASTHSLIFQDIENSATGDARQDLEILVQKVRAVDNRVLLCDLTTPDVGELGLSVVRALIPGFHPLHMGHQLRSLGGNRLWDVPQKLGYRGITRSSEDNPVPHPYP